ncbi:delta-1-pyrroline-5-carboxylate synthase-like protein [Carex littledalei]|uniref:Delta-1-pyrroline-5-carboxylate synthase-like protein n=1 Tax=Carex littledalei TaxID=544730 RepID=A0A833VI47_9POAL|nr:delta-1-pyrroline-5-carboxylate synthase-like protein [Carex littledalei]
MKKAKERVERIGTAVVTRPDGRLAVGRLGSLFEQLQELNSQGYEVILVSSGAIGVGCQCLRYRKLLNSRHTCALCAMKEVNIIPEDEKSIESLKQLQQEIWFLSQFQHPNIVQYYGSEILVDKDLNRAIVLFSSHLYRSDISGVSWSSTYSIRAFFRSLLACQRVGTFSQEVSDDGNTVVFSDGCDKQIKMWPLKASAQPITVAMHDAPVKEVAWISQINLLISSKLEQNNQIKL